MDVRPRSVIPKKKAIAPQKASIRLYGVPDTAFLSHLICVPFLERLTAISLQAGSLCHEYSWTG